MPTVRPFAYNTGTTISGTDQFGNIAVGVSNIDYSINPGGVKWWMGPDEDPGYVVCGTEPSGNQPNPVGGPAFVQFWRSSAKTENSFVSLTNYTFTQVFTTGLQAGEYLFSSGYWTSYPCQPSNSVAPTISGTNLIGNTLTGSTGTWSGVTSGYTYQWTSNGTNISSATGTTFTITETQAGATIAFVVTATNGCGSVSVTSSTITENSFISTWNTSNTSAGSSTSTQVTLPLESAGTYSGTIYWGDGTTSGLTYANRTRTYASAGTYVIKIAATTGNCTGFRFANTGDRLKILSVQRWGNLRLGNNGNQFNGCSNINLTSVADVLDTSGTTSFTGLFTNCTSLTSIANVNSWNVSAVTNFQECFGNTNFNSDISSWNVSNGTSFDFMFNGNTFFNQDISSWDVSKSTNFNFMFNGATSFNKNIGSWDVSKSTTFNSMFKGATSFNQNIGSWTIITSTTVNMGSMFEGATSFNQDIGSWRMYGVIDYNKMFQNATAFNNGGSSSINNWTIRPILTNYINMDNMFNGATAFDQNIGSWNIQYVDRFNSFMAGKTPSTFSSSNLDSIYNGWSTKTPVNGRSISFGTAKYTTSGASGRSTLTTTYSWTITDGGQA